MGGGGGENKLRKSCPTTISLKGQNVEAVLMSHYIELEWSDSLEEYM